MALRSVATTDTLGTFRTTFNSLASDSGDLSSLNTSTKSSLVAAINELSTAGFAFTIRDNTSTTQTISDNNTLNVVGDSNVNVTVSAVDTLNFTLNSNITGLTSISAQSIAATSDITINGVSVATKTFVIAQALALG